MCQADDSDSIVVTANVTVSPKQHPVTATEPTVTEPVIDLENTFPVHVNIERAFHLPMVLENRYCDNKLGVSYMHTMFSESCLMQYNIVLVKDVCVVLYFASQCTMTVGDFNFR